MSAPRKSRAPVVELDRAVALAAMAVRTAAGLEIADALPDGQRPKDCHRLPCLRGDLPHRLGRLEEAHVELDRAVALTRNERERALLIQRAAGCA